MELPVISYYRVNCGYGGGYGEEYGVGASGKDRKAGTSEA